MVELAMLEIFQLIRCHVTLIHGCVDRNRDATQYPVTPGAIRPLSPYGQTGVTPGLYSRTHERSSDRSLAPARRYVAQHHLHDADDASGLLALEIVLGRETLLHEIYPDVRTTRSRALAIRDSLVREGWLIEAA
jgi:hypothetical protein